MRMKSIAEHLGLRVATSSHHIVLVHELKDPTVTQFNEKSSQFHFGLLFSVSPRRSRISVFVCAYIRHVAMDGRELLGDIKFASFD